MQRLLIATAAILAVSAANAASITAEQAAGHVGEVATVCGPVGNIVYASGTRGQPTFIDFGREYPDLVFVALIWGSDRPKFGTPEVTYWGRSICVTGEIHNYKGKPEIIVSDPGAISVQ